jgi:hypothetical protein
MGCFDNRRDNSEFLEPQGNFSSTGFTVEVTSGHDETSLLR